MGDEQPLAHQLPRRAGRPHRVPLCHPPPQRLCAGRRGQVRRRLLAAADRGPGVGPVAPASRAFQLSSDKVVVTAFKPSDDGKAWIVRLFGASGKTEKVKLAWASPAPQQVWLSDTSEQPRAKGRPYRRSARLGHCHIAGGVSGRRGSLKEARSAWASPARSTVSIIRSGVTTPHRQPKDRRMRKAAETPCKQRAFRDPPRTPAGPLPDPFPSNTPATRAAPATTNLQERLEHPPSKRLGPFRDCTVGQGLPSPPSAVPLRRTGPPVNAVGASARRPPPRRLQPRHCPRAWEGGVAMKMKQRGSERGATLAWFTSFLERVLEKHFSPSFG